MDPELAFLLLFIQTSEALGIIRAPALESHIQFHFYHKMSPAVEVDLDAPFKEDIILEVRSSKMKTMPGLSIRSGIDKTIREGVIPVGHLGIEDDEHDPTFHGGPHKALHGCESVYPFCCV